MVRQQQTLFYEGRHAGSLYGRPPSCSGVAEAFGIAAYDLAQAHDPERMLAAAFAQPGPVLIRAPVAAEEMVLPMVTPGSSNTQMIHAASLETCHE